MSDIARALENIERERTSANAALISSFDDDPEKAAEAIRLGKDARVPPVLVNNDLDNFKRQEKTRLISTLVQENPFLRDFVANDPMAPKVAHDDIGNLDNLTINLAKTYSRALAHPLFLGQKIGLGIADWISPGPSSFTRGFVTTMREQNPELIGAFLEGSSQQATGVLQQWLQSGSKSMKDLAALSPEEYKRQHESMFEIGGPLDAISWLLETAGSSVGSAALPITTGAIGTVAGIPGGPVGMGVGAAIGAGSASYILNYGEVYQALIKAGVDPAAASIYAGRAAPIMAGLDMTGIGFIAGRFVKSAAKKEFTGTLVKRVVKELGLAGKELGLAGIAEGGTEALQEIVKDTAVSIATDTALMTKEHAKGWVESAAAGFIGGATFGTGTALVTAGHKARPYVQAGKDPPAGLDPTLDSMKADQVKVDMEALDQHLKDAQQTNLRERSPEMVSTLLRHQLGDTTIEIPSQAVVELYGDKPASPEDGILGWVPDLERQMRTEYPSGGYISVKLRDWLAYVDPEVAKILHDHILTRPTGVTINEGKTKAAQAPATSIDMGVLSDIKFYHGTRHDFPEFAPQPGRPGGGFWFTQSPRTAGNYATIESEVGANIRPARLIVRNPKEITMREYEEKYVTLNEEVANELRAEGYDAVILRRTYDVARGETGDKAGDIAEIGVLSKEQIVPEFAAEIVERNGELIANTRAAAQLGTMTDLGPEAEYMLFENRLRMQAILDRINQAKTPEELAALRQEVKEEQRTLRAEAAALRRVEPAWTGTPAAKRATLTYGKRTLNVQPVFTDPLGAVLDELNLQPVVPFAANLQPVLERVKELAANIPVHVISDGDFIALSEDPHAAAFFSFNASIRGVKLPDHIVIKESQFYGKNAARYLFHESIHAATSVALEADPTLTGAINLFMTELKRFDPSLAETYGYTDAHEFLAETLSNKEFQEKLAAIQLDERMAQALGMAEWKGKTLWQGIVDFIRRSLRIPEGSFSALEGALRLTELTTEKQKVVLVRREGPTTKAAREEQLEMLGVTRQEDLKIFEKARDVGLTVDQYIRIMKNIAEQNIEDTAFLFKQLEKYIRKQRTKEWKDAEARTKSEVENQLQNRPDIALMTFFRTGRLYGQQMGIPKIDPKLLTPEQKKLIPERWLSAKGTDPMEFANAVGYTSVDQMVERANALETALGEAKQPSLSKYVNGLVKAETERRMMKEFGGTLDENIIREVQEHVVSPTQMDRLHEDTVAMGMQNGWEMPFTKAEIIKGVKETFGKLTAYKVSMEKFLRDSGKAGKLAGIASEIDNNSTEFFKQRQNQEWALRKAGEAKVLEREIDSFERTARLMSRKQSDTIESTYYGHAQKLLLKAGLTVRNTEEEINVNIYKPLSLDAFITQEKGAGVDLDLIIPEAYEPKAIETMTVDEFREFKDVIEVLEAAGRQRMKDLYAEEYKNHEELKAEILDHVTQLPIRGKVGQNPSERLMYRLDATTVRMEEVVKDLDLREELGPLYNALIRPSESAKAHKNDMLKALADRLKAKYGGSRAWQRTLDDEIPQDFVFDNYWGVDFKLTRWNLIKMALNWGNESNKGKLARGIASAKLGRISTAEETQEVYDKIDALIHKHLTKADFDFVQDIWDIFAGWQPEEEKVIRNTAGKMPKWIEATPLKTQFGEYEGGYMPLIRDPTRPIPQERDVPAVDSDALMTTHTWRATTARPHHLERTGAVYFVDITGGIENIAGRMQQHIHDIAFREFVVSANKILHDEEIAHAIRKHYGPEYMTQLRSWIKRIANEFTINEDQVQGWNDIGRFFRTNLTAAALPLNYAVMLSPTTGATNPKLIAQAIKHTLLMGAEGRARRREILAHSEELKHTLYSLDRDITEQLNNVIEGRGPWAKWTSFQRKAVEWMYKPLVAMEQRFRSITFYGEFMHQKSLGKDDAEAASLADSLVRERHGAVSTVDLPALMASRNEIVRTATMFMGYFTMIRNWTRQIPGMARRGDMAGISKIIWGAVVVPALFNAALFTKRKEDDTIWSYFARAILDTPMSMIPYVREAYRYKTEGFKPTSPIFGAVVALDNLYKEGKVILEKGRTDKPVRRVFGAAGNLLGLPGALQIGRTGEAIYDIVTDAPKGPRDLTELVRGLATGEFRLKK